MEPYILSKIQKIKERIIKEKGPILLLAAFLRTDILNRTHEEKWDILFSATWIKSEKKTHEYLFSKFIKEFEPLKLSGFLKRVYIISPQDSFVSEITRKAGIVSDVETKESWTVGSGDNETTIKRVYIFASYPKTKNRAGAHPKNKEDYAAESGSVESSDKPQALGKTKPRDEH